MQSHHQCFEVRKITSKVNMKSFDHCSRGIMTEYCFKRSSCSSSVEAFHKLHIVIASNEDWWRFMDGFWNYLQGLHATMFNNVSESMWFNEQSQYGRTGRQAPYPQFAIERLSSSLLDNEWHGKYFVQKSTKETQKTENMLNIVCLMTTRKNTAAVAHTEAFPADSAHRLGTWRHLHTEVYGAHQQPYWTGINTNKSQRAAH